MKNRRRIALSVIVPLAIIATVPGAARAQVSVERTSNLEIPMSAGGFLRGDLYRPRIDGVLPDSLPTVVIYFPYGKDDSSRFERDMLDRLVIAGFAGLLVDIRGTGNSPGAFDLLSAREIQDGYDVVEWAAGQAFSNGDVAMWGYSYPGITAALVATLQPPHLKAIVPGAAYNDPYRDVLFPGGIRASQDSGLGGWFAAHAMVRVRQDTAPQQGMANVVDAATNPNGLDPIVQGATRTLYDEWWQERAIGERARDVEVPALFWSGWDDIYPRAQVLNHTLAASEHKALVMGPWGHIGGAAGASLDFFIDESIRWFDIFLRTPDPVERAAKLASFPPVRLFDVDWSQPVTFDGAYHGTWRAFDGWPTSAATALELCAGAAPGVPWLLQGVLADGCAVDGSVPVAGVPVEATGGISVTHDTAKGDWANPLNDPKDQRLAVAGTVFATELLEQAVTITGPLTADIWASSQSFDADWSLRVVDVGPNNARVMAQGWLRASHRYEDTTRAYLWHTHDREDLLTPGEPYRFRVEIWPTSYVVPAGHRIALVVQSADTAKVLSQNAGPSMLLVGPGHRSVLTIPIRTEGGEPVTT